MPQLSAAEILQHPEYKNVVWKLPPTKKGKVEVAKGRGGPVNIAYEIHGHGDTKLVVRRPISQVFYSIAVSVPGSLVDG